MSDILHAIGVVMLLGAPISVALSGATDPKLKAARPLAVWLTCYLAYLVLVAAAFAAVVSGAVVLRIFYDLLVVIPGGFL